jgi:hypothetical protein
MPTEAEPRYVFDGKLFKNIQLVGENLQGLPKTEVFNPYTQAWIPAGWFWGHTSGKLAARVLPNSYFTHLTHLFHTDGEIIKSDYLLHYNILSFRHFLTKYRNFKNFPRLTSLGRQVRPLRTLLVELVNDPNVTNDELLDYYLKYIAYNPEDIATIQKFNPAAIIEIESVSNFISS